MERETSKEISSSEISKSTWIIIVVYDAGNDETSKSSIVYELQRRGFVVESERSDSTKSLVAVALSQKLLIKLALKLNYAIKTFNNYSALEKLALAQKAQDIILSISKETKITSTWLSHDKTRFELLYRDKNRHHQLSLINEYFGPQIALYFVWLEHYTKYLIIPSLAGIAFYAQQWWFDTLDISTLPYFAILLAIWATIFLERWKRHCTELSYQWGLFGIEELALDYQLAKASKNEPNDHTLRIILSVVATSVLIYILYRLMLHYVDLHLRSEEVYGTTSIWRYYPMIMYSLLPTLTPLIFDPIAEFLNRYELHPTQTESEKYLIYKKFSLQFVNRNCALLYVAFWKRDLQMLRSLLISLLVTGAVVNNAMELGTPYINSAINKYIRPLITKKKGKKSNEKKQKQKQKQTDASADNTSSSLAAENKNKTADEILARETDYEAVSINDDYMEMVLQFGYVTMFAVAFPLTPLLALINNIFESKVDLTKYGASRRPSLVLRSSIGAWQTCLEVISFIAVLTNCFLLSMVSTKLDVIIPDSVEYMFLSSEYGRVIVMILLEHALLAVKFVIINLMDDIPRNIREKLARKRIEDIEKRAQANASKILRASESVAGEEDNTETPRVKTVQRRSTMKESSAMFSGQVLSSLKNDILDSDSEKEERGEEEEGESEDGESSHVSVSPVHLLHHEIQNPYGFDPLSAASLITGPLLLHMSSASPFLYIPLSIMFLAYFQATKDRIDRKAALGIVSNPVLMTLINEEMPSWIHDSEFQRVEWFNSFLQKLWPLLSVGIEKTAVEKLQPILIKNTPFLLSGLTISRFSLGSKSPKIVGIRFLNTEETIIRLDIEIRWASDPLISLKVGTRPIPTKIELSDLRVSAVIRVELLDLISSPPYFKAISITCMKKPFVDFSLKVASLDVMNIGASSQFNVTSLVRNIIHSALYSVALYPKKIIIPMVKEGVDMEALTKLVPVGIVFLAVERGTNLKSANIFGSDPYIEIKSLDQCFRTKTKYKTLNPEWNEVFEILVYDHDSQTIDMMVYDSDLTNMVKFLGRLSFNISVLKSQVEVQKEVSLLDVDHGVIHFTCNYVPLAAAQQKKGNNNNKKKKNQQNNNMNFLNANESSDIAKLEILYDLPENELNNEVLVNDYYFEDPFFSSAVQNSEDCCETSENPSIAAVGEGRASTLSAKYSHTSTLMNGTSGMTQKAASADSAAVITPSSSFRTPLSKGMSAKLSSNMSQTVGVLTVDLIKVRNIHSSKKGFTFSASFRPYASVTVDSVTKTTQVMKNMSDPHFSDVFAFPVKSTADHELRLRIMDKNKYSSDRQIGIVIINLDEIRSSSNRTIEQEYMLAGDLQESYVSVRLNWRSTV